jgi:hypothetical protein
MISQTPSTDPTLPVQHPGWGWAVVSILVILAMVAVVVVLTWLVVDRIGNRPHR